MFRLIFFSLSIIYIVLCLCVLKGEVEPATALLWAYYYLAQHFDFLKNTERALEFINLGIEHTPLLIELYVLKAKIYKVSGVEKFLLRALLLCLNLPWLLK